MKNTNILPNKTEARFRSSFTPSSWEMDRGLSTAAAANTGGMTGIGRYSGVLRPTRHIIGHFGDGFTGQMTQPTVS